MTQAFEDRLKVEMALKEAATEDQPQGAEDDYGEGEDLGHKVVHEEVG